MRKDNMVESGGGGMKAFVGSKELKKRTKFEKKKKIKVDRKEDKADLEIYEKEE